MPLDIAAHRIGVSNARLESFEAGDALPTIRQLRKIAKVYRRPDAFFYIETMPDYPERISDFRSLPDEHDPDYPDLLDTVQAAKDRRINALELAKVLRLEIPEFGMAGKLQDPPASLSKSIRSRLGVSLDEQKSWRDKYLALNGWVKAVESAGVLVFQFSGVEIGVARGFSLSERPYPVIALNGKDFPRAKVFTLLHEIAHICLGAEGVCDLHEDGGDDGSIEQFCNRVAAEALVPTKEFLNEPLVSQVAGGQWEDWRIKELATTYGVSSEVILRRLLSLGRTSEEFYKAKRSEYLEAYRKASRESTGFLHYFRRVLRDNGATFTRLVLDAYRADTVTPTEVSRLLGGVKFQHVRPIESALGRQ